MDRENVLSGRVIGERVYRVNAICQAFPARRPSRSQEIRATSPRSVEIPNPDWSEYRLIVSIQQLSTPLPFNASIDVTAIFHAT